MFRVNLKHTLRIRNKEEESPSLWNRGMESSSRERQSTGRVPLSGVVADCVKRWFKDTLKEAKAGDVNMQVLLGQMYYHGYGVPKDGHRGRIWLTKASRVRSSVWRVGGKRPGYNVSDSESDEFGDS